MRLTPAALLCTTLLLAAACEPTTRIDPSLTEDMARVAGEDVARFAFAIQDLAESVGGLPGDGAPAEECHETTGDCQLCFGMDGDSMSGELDVGSTPDCGATWQIRGRSAQYVMTETALSGTWNAEDAAGDYAIALTGTRTASLCAPTADGTVTYDASWVLDELSAATSSFGLSTITVALRYTGFAGRQWDLSLTGDAAGPVGALVIDDESVRCSVRGTWESPSISCL